MTSFRSSFEWTTNPTANQYAKPLSSHQPLSQGSVSYRSSDIFIPTRSRKTRSRTVSVVTFFDFSSPETLELRFVLGPLPGMKGLQVLTFIDGERTLRAQGATVGTRIDSVNGHKLGDLHWTKAIEVFRDSLSGELEPKKEKQTNKSKLILSNNQQGSNNKEDEEDIKNNDSDNYNNDNDNEEGEGDQTTKAVDFYFVLKYTLPEINVVSAPAPVWAVGVKFGPSLSGLGVQVESIRNDCPLKLEGVVPGSRILRVDDFELATQGTGGGISFRTGTEILANLGMLPASYSGGMMGAVKAEVSANNALLRASTAATTSSTATSSTYRPPTATTTSSVHNSGGAGGGDGRARARTGSTVSSRLSTNMRQSMGSLRGNSAGSMKTGKVVTVVYALPFAAHKDKGSAV